MLALGLLVGSDVRARGCRNCWRAPKGAQQARKPSPPPPSRETGLPESFRNLGPRKRRSIPKCSAPNCARPTCRKRVPMKFSAPCERSFGIIKPPLQIRRYLQAAQARLEELKSQSKAKDPQTSKLEAARLALVEQRVNPVREISSFFEMMLSHAETMRSESSQLLKLSSVSERVFQGFSESAAAW